jgi:putative flippase GtrA
MKFAIKIFNDVTKHTVVRYIIGGGTSAVVNLASLYLFNFVFGIYYLTASVLAFVFGFMTSLTMHKYWTFREHSEGKLHKQGALYLVTSLIGLGLNTMILYVCVEWIHLHVLAGQIVAGMLVAFCTFSMSKRFVFKRDTSATVTDVSFM